MTDLETAGAIAAIVAAVGSIITLVLVAYARRAQLGISELHAEVRGPRLHIEVSFYNPGETTTRFHLVALVDGQEVSRSSTRGSLSPSHDITLSVDVVLVSVGGNRYQLPGDVVEIAGRTNRRILTRQTVPPLT